LFGGFVCSCGVDVDICFVDLGYFVCVFSFIGLAGFSKGFQSAWLMS